MKARPRQKVTNEIADKATQVLEFKSLERERVQRECELL